MSHAVETMAYAGETPWHGLGKKVPCDLTPEQMLEAAGLDWNVKLTSVATESNGKRIVLPVKALIRNSDNKVLTVVSKGWKPIQNLEAFTFFNEFVRNGSMEMHTAGSLQGGRRVWALARIKESFEAVKGDVVESHLLFTNPHVYGHSSDIRFTPTRVVCLNTLQMALNGSSTASVKITHRSAFDPEKVKEVLGLAKFRLDEYKEVSQFLAKRRFTNEKLAEYFDFVFPRTSDADGKNAKLPSVAAKRAREVLETQPGAEFAPGTWWQAYNATSYLIDHELGKSDDTRTYSAWYGHNSKRKTAAIAKAVEMAG